MLRWWLTEYWRKKQIWFYKIKYTAISLLLWEWYFNSRLHYLVCEAFYALHYNCIQLVTLFAHAPEINSWLHNNCLILLYLVSHICICGAPDFTDSHLLCQSLLLHPATYRKHIILHSLQLPLSLIIKHLFLEVQYFSCSEILNLLIRFSSFILSYR